MISGVRDDRSVFSVLSLNRLPREEALPLVNISPPSKPDGSIRPSTQEEKTTGRSQVSR
jgi:hypothetical protein